MLRHATIGSAPRFAFAWLVVGGLGGCAPATATLAVCFAALGALLAVASLRMSKRLLAGQSRRRLVKTNIEALPGQGAAVVQRIDNQQGQGQVMLDGMEWTARSFDEQPIPEGAHVRVIGVEGVKLIVERDD